MKKYQIWEKITRSKKSNNKCLYLSFGLDESKCQNKMSNEMSLILIMPF